LVVSFKDGVGQVIKLGAARFTAIPLPVGLMGMKATLIDMA